MGLIKIVIADDHKLFRKGLTAFFADIDDMEVIDEAANGKELLLILEKKKPDIILMDLKMPFMDGIESTKFIKSTYPEIKVIVLTIYDQDHVMINLLSLGVDGYLVKNIETEEMARTIYEVHQKGNSFNSRVTEIRRKSIADRRDGLGAFLSPEELEILKLICKEYTNAEIGASLNLKMHTVKAIRKQILKKLGAKNTAGLVYQAIIKGLVDTVYDSREDSLL